MSTPQPDPQPQPEPVPPSGGDLDDAYASQAAEVRDRARRTGFAEAAAREEYAPNGVTRTA